MTGSVRPSSSPEICQHIRRPSEIAAPVVFGRGRNVEPIKWRIWTPLAFCMAGGMHFRVKNLLPSLFGEVPMPQFVIEREIPGAGNLSDAELQAVARKSVGVLKDMGPEIKWLHSYVTGDKVYCVYLAPDEEMIREHARRGGFPANRISAVRRLIDPGTAN